MPKLKYYFILSLLVCMGLSVPAGAECWRWTTKTLPGPEWKSPNDYHFMAHDESLQKLVLFTFQRNDHHTWDTNLWTYEGSSWKLLWTGQPELEPGWYLVPPWGLVYDLNHQALLLFANIFFQQPEYPCTTVFKFIPDQGWERVYGCIPISCTESGGDWVITYDSNRRTSIITGGGEYIGALECGPPVTVEFDGWSSRVVHNPSDYDMAWGAAGFNPETGKTIFYGYGRVLEYRELETFEYDGTTWSLIETAQKPYTDEGPITGLVYVPRLHGLIGVPSYSGEYFQTWLFKDSEWRQIPLDARMPDRLHGILGFDKIIDKAIYWGGRVRAGVGLPISRDTLEFSSYSHCRPVSRP
jgi:hypothetical protein